MNDSVSIHAATINEISRYLNYFAAIPMILFGSIGAFLTIIVFTTQKSFRRNPTTIYLSASAVMTGIHLPTIYSQSILVDGFLLGVFNTNDRVRCPNSARKKITSSISLISRQPYIIEG